MMQAQTNQNPPLFGHSEQANQPSALAQELSAIIELVDGKTVYGNTGNTPYETVEYTTKASKFEKVMRAFGAQNLGPCLSIITGDQMYVAYITHSQLTNIEQWRESGDSPIGLSVVIMEKGFAQSMIYSPVGGYLGGYQTPRLPHPGMPRYMGPRDKHGDGRELSPESKAMETETQIDSNGDLTETIKKD